MYRPTQTIVTIFLNTIYMYRPTQAPIAYPTCPNACFQEEGQERLVEEEEEQEDIEEEEVDKEVGKMSEDEDTQEQDDGANEVQPAGEAERGPSGLGRDADDATAGNFADDQSAPASIRSNAPSRQQEEGKTFLKKIPHCSLEDFASADDQKSAVRKAVIFWMQVSHVPSKSCCLGIFFVQLWSFAAPLTFMQKAYSRICFV